MADTTISLWTSKSHAFSQCVAGMTTKIPCTKIANTQNSNKTGIAYTPITENTESKLMGITEKNKHTQGFLSYRKSIDWISLIKERRYHIQGSICIYKLHSNRRQSSFPAILKNSINPFDEWVSKGVLCKSSTRKWCSENESEWSGQNELRKWGTMTWFWTEKKTLR